MDRFSREYGGAGTVVLTPNHNESGAGGHDLYIEVKGSFGSGWLSIKGKAEIEKFVYAAAVHGGLVEDGDVLKLKPRPEVPANGMYLAAKPIHPTAVFVEDGRIFVPQYESGIMLDCTEEALDRGWVLTPMKREPNI